MSNQTSRNSKSNYFINDNKNHIPGSLTRWDDSENLDNSLATIDDLGNLICPCVESNDILTNTITAISSNLDLVTNHLKIRNGSDENLVINNWSNNTAVNLITSDVTGTQTNTDYLINNSNENQAAQIFLNFPILSGAQFYNRCLDSFSGNSNDLIISTFHNQGQAPVESIKFRLNDEINGIVGTGVQAVNVLPNGSEIMKLELADTTINNNLILNSAQITAAPINPLDVVNKSYADSLGGNPFDQNLNTTDDVEFNSITLSSGSETGSSLSFYKEINTFITMIGGTGYNRSVLVRIARIGRIVSVFIERHDDTQTTSSTLDLDPIPLWATGPKLQGTCIILDAGVTKMGQYELSTTGIFKFGNLSNYSTGPSSMGTGNCGVGGFSVSYTV